MKKILFLSLILLCTAMSAWSYTTGSVTLSNSEADRDTGQATDPKTGISVRSTFTKVWAVGGKENGMLILGVPFLYVVTGVSFKCNGSITHCDELVWNAESNEWVQANGALTYNSKIYFQNDTEEAMVFSVTITYHKHDFFPHEGVAATCTTPGMMEYWECSDCGHIYSNDVGAKELSRTSLEIPATNHKNKIYVEAKPATDTEDGYTVDHWHCQDCGKNFADEECTKPITENVIIRAKSRDWLCFTANTSSSTVQLNKVGDPYEAALEYTTTETDWHTYTFGQTIMLTDAGDRVYFRKADEGVAIGFSNNQYQYSFAMTGKIAASGNVMSLIDNTCEATTIPGTYCFAKLFEGCTSLTSAPRLPATTLKGDCYYCMFLGCTNLTTPPVLPATTLAASCYSCMFSGCTKLATAPMLPATTLKEWCYSNMFKNCTSLTTAPELPATAMIYHCYYGMFSGCTNLNHVKVAFTKWTDSSTYIPENWLNGVASTGTFVCPDALDKSQTGASYIPEGWTPVFEVKANKDPESVNYYSTFYSGTNAYEVPSGVTAYTGVVEESASNPDESVLKLTAIEGGIIPAEEPVILKATKSQVYLPYTTETAINNPDNKLEGIDVETTLSANQYALSLGQKGVGFYLWEGKAIGANKAYLTLPSSFGAKAFIFQFDDDPTGIESLTPALSEGEGAAYNLNGVRVDDNYKGIVIKNGKKIYQK